MEVAIGDRSLVMADRANAEGRAKPTATSIMQDLNQGESGVRHGHFVVTADHAVWGAT